MAETKVSDAGTRIGGLMEEALAQHRGGNLAGAERIYAAILEIDRRNAQALTLLGTLQAQQGKFEDAERSLAQSLKIERKQPFALNSLGNVLHALKRHRAAIARYEQAIALKPDHAAAYSNRGNALKALDRYADALASYDKATAIDPSYAEAHVRRGDALRELKRHDEAVLSYEKAVRLRPHDVQILFNKSIALQEAGRAKDALASYDATLALKPDHAEAHNNRGNVLVSLGRYEKAFESYKAAIDAKPDYAAAYNNYSNALLDVQRLPDALKNIEKVLALDPDFPYALGQRLTIKSHMCDWQGLSAARDAVVDAIGRGSLACAPFSLVATDVPAGTRRRCAELYVQDRCPPVSPPLYVRAKTVASRSDRIRIAYLSADFHAHATAHLMAGVFEQHDKGRFEISAISFDPSDGSPMRARLEAAFEHFIPVNTLHDKAVAALMRDANIDIAVDLKGFTKNARPGDFRASARAFAGELSRFSGDDGCELYRLSDRRQDRRPGARAGALLREARLSSRLLSVQRHETLHCSGNADPRGRRVARERFRLLFVQQQLQADTGALRRLDAAAPPDRGKRAVDSQTPTRRAAQNLRVEAEHRGISRERLVFAPKVQHADHLARHRLADLFLDTVPCGAHTTASDALWAGLPMLTCMGDSFAGRVGASLLNAIGLKDLVTQSLPEYERLALALARDPRALAHLEGEARKEPGYACPLFDTARFTRHLEAAYLRMWDRHTAGQPPASFSVDATETERQ